MGASPRPTDFFNKEKFYCVVTVSLRSLASVVQISIQKIFDHGVHTFSSQLSDVSQWLLRHNLNQFDVWAAHVSDYMIRHAPKLQALRFGHAVRAYGDSFTPEFRVRVAKLG